MKTVVEQVMEAFEYISGKPFSEKLKKEMKELALEEIKKAWISGNEDGWSTRTDDYSKYLNKYKDENT